MQAIRPDNSAPVRRLVLVADDEAPIRMVVSEKLRSSGFDVIDAPDGEEAFDKATQRRPDFVITDLQMPYMSGLDLAMRIAGDERTRGVPMILLTARGHVLNQAQLGGTSIRRIMAKPFSARELVSVVQHVLEQESTGLPGMAGALPLPNAA